MIRPVGTRDARRALEAKGFHKASGARDHEMYILHVDGAKTNFWVKLSHGAGQMRIDEIKNNARAIRTTGDDLYRIVSCEHDAAATKRVFLDTRERS
jgi:hypothetical protein